MKKFEEEFLRWIRSWGTNLLRTCILEGQSGSGKTTFAEKILKQEGYDIIFVSPEMDEETVEKILSCRTGLTKSAILVEGIEAFDRKIIELILKCDKPVIVTTTEIYRLDNHLKSHSYVIHVPKPDVRTIMNILKKKNNEKKVAENISMLQDFRQASLSEYGSEGYQAEGGVYRYLETGNIEYIEQKDITLLLDNAQSNFFGKELYFFIRALEIADRVGNLIPLKNFRKRFPKVERSYFYMKLSSKSKHQ
ncbi:MAG: ATP-binding protein [Candidatus Nanoarchaeia archaeon]|nr:ATP-binding protein [Candidatus Jingweiarchaeum tengchongense]